jgi:hypothetical protein
VIDQPFARNSTAIDAASPCGGILAGEGALARGRIVVDDGAALVGRRAIAANGVCPDGAVGFVAREGP